MDTQSKQVSEYASRMDEYDKKFEENSRKFGTLLAVSPDISEKSNHRQTIAGTEQMQDRAAVLPVQVTPDAGKHSSEHNTHTHRYYTYISPYSSLNITILINAINIFFFINDIWYEIKSEAYQQSFSC